MSVGGQEGAATLRSLRPGALSARRHFWFSLAVMFLLASCGGTDGSSAPLPAAPPVVEVSMKDLRFEYEAKVASGRAIFLFINRDRLPHRPVLLALPEGLPPIEKQLHGAERAFLSPFAGVPARAPGETGTFAVDLVPGRRYALICTLRDGVGRPHALRGMASEFRADRRVQEVGR